MIIYVFDRVENIVGKGENAGLVTSIFSFSHNVLKRLFSETHQKMSLCGNGLRFWPFVKEFSKFESHPIPICYALLICFLVMDFVHKMGAYQGFGHRAINPICCLTLSQTSPGFYVFAVHVF